MMNTSEAQIFNTNVNGSSVGPASIDTATFNFQTIAHGHHEIHEGGYYHVAGSANAAADDEYAFCVSTPNTSTWSHLFWNVSVKGESVVELWEGADTSGGTLVTPNNRNRNCPATANTTVMENCVVSGAAGSGARLDYIHTGAGKVSASMARDVDEWVLKSGTTYLFIVRSEVNNNISTSLDWYEHTDKIKQF